LDVW